MFNFFTASDSISFSAASNASNAATPNFVALFGNWYALAAPR